MARSLYIAASFGKRFVFQRGLLFIIDPSCCVNVQVEGTVDLLAVVRNQEKVKRC